MGNLNELTISDFTNIFNYLLDNNKRLYEEGQTPIAIGIEGEAGIGKTSIIEQIAKKRGMTFCKLNLAELEEVGDLTGFPQKEVLLEWKGKDGNIKTKWYSENMLNRVPSNVKITSKTRMSYAPPAWLPAEENENGLILCLDDFSRSNALFMQATMELINTGKYISWELPKNTSVILTSNPDNGNYSVSSLDNAQKTRFINFNLKLNINDWASWAESVSLDSRCINFALMYGDEIFAKHNNVQIANPRAYTTFCKAIGGIDNWNDANSLSMIINISKGCFLEDNNNSIGNLFTMFLSKHLDKLVTPKDMLEQSWNVVEPIIYECVYDFIDSNPVYKPEVASILSTRLLNYLIVYLGKKGSDCNKVQTRLLDFIDNKRKLFSEDLLFHIIKNIVAKYPSKATKLLSNPLIRNKVII
jgi:hypothetical protein